MHRAGWVALAGLGCDVDDPDELFARAERALACARAFGDVDLEAKALADGGLARVQAGRIAEGMAMLDEANALWCGPAANRGAATMGVCSFFTACYYAADFERAGWWVDDLRRVGILGQGSLGPTFITGHCESVQATALIELGRWSEADALLTRSLHTFETATGAAAWHPAIALADLRTREGRLAEAETLLLGKDAHLQALLPTARLHLARGDAGLAAATARRGLRLVGADRLRGTDLLSIVVEAEVAAGDLLAAADACREMADRGLGLGEPALAARATRANALVLAAGGQPADAISLVENTVDALEARLAVQRLMLTLDLITLHERAGNRAAADVEARRARSMLTGLDITLPPTARSLLDRYAELTGAPPPEAARLYRDGDTWLAASAGVVVRLRTTKGVRYLAELLGAPGCEKHALDLVDRVEGVAEGLDRRRLGSAGEVADVAARSAYRSRVEALRTAIGDALAAGEDDRAATLEDECAALTTELLTAFGLGGRGRLVASAAERARLNVTRAVRTTIERIGEALPEAGRVLDQRIRTGLYCAFEPDPGDAVRWSVHS
ncbi:hypothetical protein [Nocardioides jiangxiensis]|uniref:MalT-like TPR region domain-containing protein n=1 Tax=Nocardioides jiangxiensis TaxID=3064524 RepID=A0ABT9B111_9ACTN|nr:hypothetical protein [Nocardioides sp. WY-20]MDO7868358.1 hypothetical protein [Nocardioides sp. WY-20]